VESRIRTSVPRRDNRRITITVKATPEGFLSTHLVNGVKPGTIVRLAAPKGDFALPDPPPPKILFVSAGSGITPLIAMLRSLRTRGERPDILHIHSAPSADSVIFHDELRDLEKEQPSYRLHLQLTESDGHLDFDHLDRLVPDWQDRPTWACGPTAMLDAVGAGQMVKLLNTPQVNAAVMRSRLLVARALGQVQMGSAREPGICRG